MKHPAGSVDNLLLEFSEPPDNRKKNPSPTKDDDTPSPGTRGNTDVVCRDVDATGRPAYSDSNLAGLPVRPLAVWKNLRLSDVEVNQVLVETVACLRRLY